MSQERSPCHFYIRRYDVASIEDRALFERALLRWGATAQVNTAMEEMGECIAAMNQYFFRGKISASMMASEIADVEIMCEQLRLIVGDGIVDKKRAYKLRRLRKLINK
jgi:NTP pyrophosphatase (non-canonical NTP hydrolase)